MLRLVLWLLLLFAMKRAREPDAAAQPSSAGLFPLAAPLEGRFLLYGNICLDLLSELPSYPREDSHHRAVSSRKSLGGNCANSCTALAQLLPGQRPGRLVSCVGVLPAKSDPDAAFAMSTLEDAGADTSLLEEVSDGSGLPVSFVLLSQDTGSRTIVSTRRGLRELHPGRLGDVLRQAQDEAASKGSICWCHLECRQPPETMLQMADAFRPKGLSSELMGRLKTGSPVLSVEVEKTTHAPNQLKPLMQISDVVFFSKDFIVSRRADLLGHTEKEPSLDEAVSNDEDWHEHLALRALRSYSSAACCHRALWVCPWGALGAFALDTGTGQEFFQPARVVDKVVDSCGAGDTFIASCICALAMGATPQEALCCGCAVAGAKVSQHGLSGLARYVPAEMPWLRCDQQAALP